MDRSFKQCFGEKEPPVTRKYSNRHNHASFRIPCDLYCKGDVRKLIIVGQVSLRCQVYLFIFCCYVLVLYCPGPFLGF